MIRKAFKFPIYPTAQQEELLIRHCNAARFAYNFSLRLRIEAYKKNKANLSAYDLKKILLIYKNSDEVPFIQNLSTQALCNGVFDMDAAYKHFFRRVKQGVTGKEVGFPKFRKRHNGYRYKVDGLKVDDKKVYIPYFKEGIKAYLYREMPGELRSATISRTKTKKWYISILVQIDAITPPEPKPVTLDNSIGIDVGLKTYAVLSDGTEYPKLMAARKMEPRMRRVQRRISRMERMARKCDNCGHEHQWLKREWNCVKCGHKNVRQHKNLQKMRLKKAKMDEKVVNQRENYQHAISREIINREDVQHVFIEDLNIKGMLKNRKLSKAISDASFYGLFAKLKYKGEWAGKTVNRIDRFAPSSKQCPCGYINKELKLSDREWTCPECGTTHDRDLLAANNIKRMGMGTPAGEKAQTTRKPKAKKPKKTKTTKHQPLQQMLLWD